MIKKVLVRITLCLLILTPSLHAHPQLLPIIYAAGVTLPNTKKVITPATRDVEEQLAEALAEKYEIGFVHSVEGKSTWYGVIGTVQKEIPARTEGGFASFKVTFDDLLQIHSPSKNIKTIKSGSKKKPKGSHFCSSFQVISDVDSPQIVTAFVREFLLPRIPAAMRSRSLRSKLNKATSINQVLLSLIDAFGLRVSEEQAVYLLEHNFSVQDKTTLVMEILAEKVQSGGGHGDSNDEIDSYREQLASLDIPEEVRMELSETLDHYEKSQNNPHEAPLLSRYLKFAFALPWNTSDPEEFDLAHIEHRLNTEQFGMSEVKDRVIDYLALRNLSPTPLPTVLCLVGPPGVGKTSIVKIVADAMGKKYSRVALGGVSAEGEIRGHRRTYVGAMAGRILDAIKRAGTNNPVILMDEVDKLSNGNTYHGDPTAALLEALDPEQNHAFFDHYLDVPFDLSKVIFVATANNLHEIPDALRDRMDIIQVPKYTPEEKIIIARNILIPKMIVNAGLAKKPPKFSDDVIRRVVDDYTFEAGVRGLKNKLHVLLAKYARGFLKDQHVTFEPNNLEEFLGRPHGQLEEIKRKAKDIEPHLNTTADNELFKQIHLFDRLKQTDPSRQRVKEYISFFTDLPWGTTTVDNHNLTEVEEHLHKTHYGMHKVTERILDYLALRARSDKVRATILCLVGPPGVGKTSICKEIAHALGKKFDRIALGGVNHESDIRGANRVYQGAAPGRILQGIMRAGSKNALIALDEMDKIGYSNSSPTAALLEALDPEQNKEFMDHFLNVPFDLSQILFIATANNVGGIPLELLDRMEVIFLDGYNTKQKVAIAQDHILPRLLEQARIDETPPTMDEDLITSLIRNYTMEAGVRQLTARLNRLLAKYARSVAKNDPVRFDPDNLIPHLGAPYPRRDPMPTVDKVGVVNGLFAGGGGGGLNTIEVTVVPGKGQLTMTGSMGDMATESVKAAVGYLRNNASKWGFEPHQVHDVDIHVHMPDAATPKDGPSAGAAMVTGVLSAATKQKVRSNFAMTGEVSLHGDILPIGGVEQKLEGARRNGMTHVFFPEDNRGDVAAIHELPDDIEILFASHVDQILERVLLPAQPTSDVVAK